ncbi:enoyl-CoA hydratase-related protein [Stakelama sediminis]|uniref:Enoyl-CoA hydratase/carnithine racemase n=1 Tax=Stakelama sediminis TaxID=463200 RepID=A0A840YZH5_9SPHN|nr:enoyl-CoA hydratase/isomerase family protein [Stakelama sediminis]MBB5718904.1 enoyl-CoA hydratase/carnithine racemase [Stakelama sediminis]
MFSWTLADQIARLRIARAGARNAISMTGWADLRQCCAQIADSDARVVLLYSSAEGIFSAGADIGEFDALRSNAGQCRVFRETMAAGIEAVAALPMPVIAAVDGGCYGAAVALVLACDIRVAGEGAVFATTPAKLGLSYPGSDVARLKAAVGPGFAAQMLFAGAPVDAETAVRRGLADLYSVEAESAAVALAGTIAANAPEALRALKGVWRDPGASHTDAAFDARFASAEFGERLAAFHARKRR